MAFHYKLFTLLLLPDVVIGELPPYFFERFKDELKDKVWLQDQNGTRFGVLLFKCKKHGFFHRGIEKMFEHYHQPEGIWVSFAYVGDNTFNIGVYNIDMQPVTYPPASIYPHLDRLFTPKEYLNVVGGMINPSSMITGKHPDSPPEEYPPWNCDYDPPFLKATGSEGAGTSAISLVPNAAAAGTDHEEHTEMVNCDIKLTQYKASSNNLNIPAEFVKKGRLSKSMTNIILQDEEGDVFECKLRWSTATKSTETFLVGRWKEFVTEHGLKSGSRVRLSVDPNSPSKIYAAILEV